jgi:hypothetical protein
MRPPSALRMVELSVARACQRSAAPTQLRRPRRSFPVGGPGSARSALRSSGRSRAQYPLLRRRKCWSVIWGAASGLKTDIIFTTAFEKIDMSAIRVAPTRLLRGPVRHIRKQRSQSLRHCRVRENGVAQLRIGRSASIAVCTAVMTSRASAPIIRAAPSGPGGDARLRHTACRGCTRTLDPIIWNMSGCFMCYIIL